MDKYVNGNEGNDDKALTMKLYDGSALDPYLGLSTMARNKLITKKNALNWHINTDLKYITSDELTSWIPELFTLDKADRLLDKAQAEEVVRTDENIELLSSGNERSLLLSSKRQAAFNSCHNSNIHFNCKKIKMEKDLGLSQECTYTTNNLEIIESDEEEAMIMENGYVRGETLLTFFSELTENEELS